MRDQGDNARRVQSRVHAEQAQGTGFNPRGKGHNRLVDTRGGAHKNHKPYATQTNNAFSKQK